MNKFATWCLLGACTTLAACPSSGGGSGGTGTISFTPIAAEFDGYPAMGSTMGVSIPVLSANRGGLSDTDARITFDADSFTVTIPGFAPITISGSAVPDGPIDTHEHLLTTHKTYHIGTDTLVEIHLGEEADGSDLFLLAGIDDSTGTVSPSPLTYVVFGDETDTLPSGTATYTGGFTSNILDAAGDWFAERSGTTTMSANFGTGAIGLTMSVVGEGEGEVYTGTGSITTGARYEGTTSSTGTGTPFVGNFNGDFFGTDADGTAGTFNATNGASETILGGFAGFKD